MTTRTAHYLRARRSSHAFNLQQAINKARSSHGTVSKSEVKIGTDVLRIQHFRDNGQHILLHIIGFEPGIAASTVRAKVTAREDDEEAQAAPTGKEFKRGEAFVFVKAHHVAFMGSGLSLPRTATYLASWFQKAGLEDTTKGFDIAPVANMNKVAVIQKQGVKAIHLTTSAYGLSVPESERKGLLSRFVGGAKDMLLAAATQDLSEEEESSLEDLIVDLEVRLDGNTRASPKSQRLLQEMAESVVGEGDGAEFSIETQSGEVIRPSEVRVNGSLKVERINDSISYSSAWQALATYFESTRGLA